MKTVLGCALVTVALWSMAGCETQPVQRVAVPPPNDMSAYQPMVQPKPLPADAGGQVQQATPATPVAGQPMAPAGLPAQPMSADMLPNEPAFIAAYAERRSPRMMVFVNRTIHGDPLPKDGLEELIRVEDKQTATGGVNVSNEKSVVGTANTAVASAGYAGSVTGTQNVNVQGTNKSSFESTGPADYTHTTSVKVAAAKHDEIGATAGDYELIEASLTEYFDSTGRVNVRDSEMARSRLGREKLLRIENSDPAAIRLLNTELQTDVLVQVKAFPTNQASVGNAVRLIAKAVSTTDARNLGQAFVDMPLPISKTNVNIYTKFLANELMGKMAQKWSAPAEYDPVEVRVYKAAGVDDALTIRKFLGKLAGVSEVRTNAATGGSTTSYASFAVAFKGAPEDLYGELKDALGQSTGLKAVDLTSNTISLEVTGAMNLTTTTRTVEKKTTVETTTTEQKKVDAINPAPPGQ